MGRKIFKIFDKYLILPEGKKLRILKPSEMAPYIILLNFSLGFNFNYQSIASTPGNRFD